MPNSEPLTPHSEYREGLVVVAENLGRNEGVVELLGRMGVPESLHQQYLQDMVSLIAAGYDSYFEQLRSTINNN